MTDSATHPFRDNTPKPVCVVAGCESLAHLRCPKCKRPFCIDHVVNQPSCVDCQRPITLRELRGVRPGLRGLKGLFSRALAAARRRWGRSAGWEPVVGNTLRVSADDELEKQGRRRVGLVGLRRRARAAFQNSIGRFRLG